MRFLQKARGILFLRLAFLFFLWYTECGTKFYNAHESGDERAFRISFFRFHGNFVPTNGDTNAACLLWRHALFFTRRKHQWQKRSFGKTGRM